MRIMFWAGDQGSGSTWYRCQLPALGLHWLGHDCVVHHQLGPHWRGADVVIASRPAAPGVPDMIRSLRDHGKRVLVDLDDDYFSLDSRHHQQAAVAQWADNRDRLVENIKLADGVIAASTGLVEVLSQYRDDVVLIPNALPAWHMATPRDYANPSPIVGWSGSGSSAGGLELIKHTLRKLAEAPGGRVLLAGLEATDPALRGLRGRPNIRTTGFIPNQDAYLAACAEFDIWLAPYEESAFNRAKFPTKVLESNFLGIPLVASAIKPYVEQVEHGVTGFLVRSDHEWRRYVNRLVGDPDLRRSIGMAARAQASASILQAMNQRWEKVCTG